MNTALQISTPAGVIPAQSLSSYMFDDFIAYIDRPGKTAQTYITNLKQFCAWMLYKGITQPQRADVIQYRDYLSTDHEAIQLDPDSPQGWSYRTTASGHRFSIRCRPATVNQYLRSVKQFFSWAAAAGLYPDIARNIHGPKISNETHKKEALTAADVLKVETSISLQAEGKRQRAAVNPKDTAGRVERATEQGARLRAMYMLAVNVGLRTVEISRANVKDIQVKDGKACIYIWGKGHTEPDAKKPIAPGVYEAIRDYLDNRSDRPTPNSPLFVSTGNRSGGQRIAATTISRMLKKALQSAGYDSDRITAHSLRHTAGTNAMKVTGDLFEVQNYMRHRDPKTTEIYLHVETEEQESETARALYNLYHGITEQRDTRQRLENILDRMTPDKLEQLARVAAAMC